MKYIPIFLKSIFIGIGAIAPGLSGGALAMIFGLYERLIDAISHLFSKLKANFAFLASVALGAGLGIVAFAVVQRYLLSHYQMQTLFVFAGLVIGTLPNLFKEANKEGYKHQYLIPFVVTLGCGIVLALLNQNELTLTNPGSIDINLKNMVFLGFAGFILAGSLVIPGVSGTVLLMLVGVYGIFLNALADFKNIIYIFSSQTVFQELVHNIVLLLPVGVGLLMGAIFYAKVMKYLFKQYYGYTYYGVLGFVVGSILELYPGFTFNQTGISSLIFGLAATVISLELNKRLVK